MNPLLLLALSVTLGIGIATLIGFRFTDSSMNQFSLQPTVDIESIDKTSSLSNVQDQNE
ncbi:hypothetical protein HYW32_00435 [Candidatus Berkelbacteria bacterium]|nr:hypothetical protein [Candidatus Berkelbacteria bacterium]